MLLILYSTSLVRFPNSVLSVFHRGSTNNEMIISVQSVSNEILRAIRYNAKLLMQNACDIEFDTDHSTTKTKRSADILQDLNVGMNEILLYEEKQKRIADIIMIRQK